MKGLLLKDFINLKSTFKILSVFFIVFAIVYITMGNSSFIGVIIFMFTMMVVTSISFDDMAKWDSYALTMPISREEIVRSKYILLLIMGLISAVLALVFVALDLLISGSSFDLEKFVYIFFLMQAALMFGSILIPLIYKFGTEKARLIIILLALTPIAIVIFFESLNLSLPSLERAEIMALLFGLCVLIPSGSLIISYLISVKIYKNKEF